MNILVIAAERLDAHMQGVLLRPDSLARKVIAAMIATTPGGGGGGGTVVSGTSPITITDLGDGIGELTVVGVGATVEEQPDGTIILTLGGAA